MSFVRQITRKKTQEIWLVDSNSSDHLCCKQNQSKTSISNNDDLIFQRVKAVTKLNWDGFCNCRERKWLMNRKNDIKWLVCKVFSEASPWVFKFKRSQYLTFRFNFLEVLWRTIQALTIRGQILFQFLSELIFFQVSKRITQEILFKQFCVEEIDFLGDFHIQVSIYHPASFVPHALVLVLLISKKWRVEKTTEVICTFTEMQIWRKKTRNFDPLVTFQSNALGGKNG